MPRLNTKRRKVEPMKRSLPASSDEDSTQAAVDTKTGPSRESRAERAEIKGRNKKEVQDANVRSTLELKQKIKKSECERRKLEERLTAKKEQLKEIKEKLQSQTRALDKVKKDRARLKKANDKLEKDKQELESTGKKWKKKMESYRLKLTELESEKSKLENRVVSLQLSKSNSPSENLAVAGAASAGGSSDLFQDMMDNFRELAETQFQCAICSEIFVSAVSINCGHTFCDYCITEWRKKKNNCPVCRTNIRAVNPVKVLDEYSDKVYEQFVPEGARQTRSVLKEERSKLKKENEKTKSRLGRAGYDLDHILDSLVDSDNSIDSDGTLELRFNSDFDSDVSDEIIRFNPSFSESDNSDYSSSRVSPVWAARNLLSLVSDDESDSSDEDFSIRGWNSRNRQQLSSSSSSSLSSSSSSSSEDSGDEGF